MSTADRAQVAIVQHSVRRYRERFYELLRERLAASGVRLRLIHSDEPARLEPRPHKAGIPWAEVRPARRLGIRERTLLWQPVVGMIRDVDLVIVEQAAQLLTNYLLLAGQRLGGPPVAFWGHGHNFLLRDGHRGAPEAVKGFVSRCAHWWFAYNDRAADAVVALGYPRERITVVDNATDTRWLAAQVARVTAADLAGARRELGIAGSNVGLFLGTLGAVKRLDHLFAAADLVRRDVPDFELVVAGYGMEEPAVAEWTSQRPWAHYAGPRFGHDVVPLLAMTRLLLVPAWAGLVIVDGFGAGVPLVASASHPHPPEIAYLVDGVNGRLVDDDGDPGRYADAVAALLRDEDHRQTLVRGCVEARNRYSVEAMAERFASGVLAALQAHTR